MTIVGELIDAAAHCQGCGQVPKFIEPLATDGEWGVLCWCGTAWASGEFSKAGIIAVWNLDVLEQGTEHLKWVETL